MTYTGFNIRQPQISTVWGAAPDRAELIKEGPTPTPVNTATILASLVKPQFPK